MHIRIRAVAAASLLALAVAACGSSASPSPTPVVSPSPVASPTAASSGAPASSSPDASTGASPTPTATPTVMEQALMDRLPAEIAGIKLAHSASTLAKVQAVNPGAQTFVDYAATLGVDPANVVLAYAYPESTIDAQWIYGAYQFAGADPAKLASTYVEAAIAAQEGASSEKVNVGGRDVVKLIPGSAAAQKNPPVYVAFVGDTIYFGATDDEKLAESMVASFPK